MRRPGQLSEFQGPLYLAGAVRCRPVPHLAEEGAASHSLLISPSSFTTASPRRLGPCRAAPPAATLAPRHPAFPVRQVVGLPVPAVLTILIRKHHYWYTGLVSSRPSIRPRRCPPSPKPPRDF